MLDYLRWKGRHDRVVLLDLAGLGGTTWRPEVVEELDVGLVEVFPLIRRVVLVEDRLDRAHRLTCSTVHALIGVDIEHSLALVDAVDGAFVDTRLVDHVDTGLGDDVGHDLLLGNVAVPSIHDHHCHYRQGSHVSTVGSTPSNQPRWPERDWVTYATGRRISVRMDAGMPGPTGRPGYRDVVGVLEVGSAHHWVLRTKDGDAVTVDPDSVVAAKVVPDARDRLRTASDIDIASLELIAADGWQPLERDALGDWLLRAAHGFTGRANSVLPIGEPGMQLEVALDAVQSWYEARSLPAMFQLPLPLRADLDAQLTARGWDHFHPTHVMVCDLDQLRMATHGAADPDDRVSLTTAEAPDDDWMDAFRYRGMRLQPEVTPILTLNDHPVFITARGSDRATRAIGRGAVTDRWLGITAVEVGESFRRQGLGRRVIAALADYAAAHGARHAYLQVAEDNGPAIALYEHLGFRHHHDYVYRRWGAG